jgi:hypothetical protein
LRRGVVVVGALILVAGAAAAISGFVLLQRSVSPAANGFLGTPVTVVVSPDQNVSIGTTQPGTVSLVTYEDNASAPLSLSAGGATAVSRTTTKGGEKLFVSVIVSATSSYPVTLRNNSTAPISLKYSFSASPIGSFISGGLLLVVGGLLAAAGVVVMVVGVVLKRKAPPGGPQA